MVIMSLVPHQKSTTSSIDQQRQTQDQSAFRQFEFINTTTNVQYSGRGSRTVARSHVMRNFHRKKGKSKLQQKNLHSPGASPSIFAPARVQGESNANRSSSRLIGVDGPGLHRLDENAMHDLTQSEKEGNAENYSALWLRPPYQGSDQERHELPMSNLWALPVDAHATELICHCKPCLFHICSGQGLHAHC